MKSPHNQRPDEQARTDTEAFIARYAGRPALPRTRQTSSKRAAGKAKSPARAAKAPPVKVPSAK
jgi:hypothetical protein